MLAIHLAGSQGSCRPTTAPWEEVIYTQVYLMSHILVFTASTNLLIRLENQLFCMAQAFLGNKQSMLIVDLQHASKWAVWHLASMNPWNESSQVLQIKQLQSLDLEEMHTNVLMNKINLDYIFKKNTQITGFACLSIVNTSHVAISLGTQYSAERDINRLSNSMCAGQRSIKIFPFATFTQTFLYSKCHWCCTEKLFNILEHPISCCVSSDVWFF